MKIIRFILSSLTIVLLVGCGGYRFPAWDPSDEGAVIYYARAVGVGAEVGAVRVDGAPAPETGWTCDPRAAVLPIGDDRLVFAYNGALYAARPGEEPRVLADFGSGVAREVQTGRATGEDVVASWRVDNIITEIRMDGSGSRVAFRLDQLLVPLKKEPASKYSKAELAAFTDVDSFYVDEGAYVLDSDGAGLRYLLPTAEVFCFLDETYLALEQGLTLCRVDTENTSDVAVIVPDDRFEMGWVPRAAAGGGSVVVLCNKAKPGSDTIIVNGLYVLHDGRLPNSPQVSIEFTERATRVLVSPDGRYAAVDILAGALGGTNLYIAEIETGAFGLLAENGAVYTFLPSSSGLVYFEEGETPGRGDLRAIALDGTGLRRLTDTGGVLAPR